MNTSTIQDFQNVETSQSSTPSHTPSRSSDPEDFRRMFKAELSYDTEQRPGLKPSDDLPSEAQASLSLSVSDSNSKPAPDTVHPKGSDHGGGSDGKQTVANTKSSDVNAETDAEGPAGSQTKKGVPIENGRTIAVEGKESGKNVSLAKDELNGEAKTAARPSLLPGEKLTYGDVRKVENAKIGAGYAASSSIQTMNYHHGTPHASSVSRPENGSLSEGSDRSGTMASNVMKNDTSTRATGENEGGKGILSAAMKPIAGMGSASSNTSFSGGQFEESGQFAGKESHALNEVQHINKPQFVVPTSTSTMVDSIRKMQSMIQDQVMVLKSVNHQTMQVMIRPDANMSLFLTLNQGDAEVMVAARMDHQTSNLLKPHWAELQKELEQHGIQLGDPDAQFEQQSQRQQRDQSEEEKEAFYDSQSMFHSRRQTSSDVPGNKESIHVLDPDFENTQGTLVSWA